MGGMGGMGGMEGMGSTHRVLYPLYSCCYFTHHGAFDQYAGDTTSVHGHAICGVTTNAMLRGTLTRTSSCAMGWVALTPRNPPVNVAWVGGIAGDGRQATCDWHSGTKCTANIINPSICHILFHTSCSLGA